MKRVFIVWDDVGTSALDKMANFKDAGTNALRQTALVSTYLTWRRYLCVLVSV